MWKDDTFKELLYGGLQDDWKLMCKLWVDDTKELFNVSTDQQVIAEYSDNVILPILTTAATLFKNKSIIYADFVGLPTPRFEMYVSKIEGRPAIVIHEGFVMLYRFLNELHFLSNFRYMIWDSLTQEEKGIYEEKSLKLDEIAIRIAIEFCNKPFHLPTYKFDLPAEFGRLLDDELVSVLAFSIFHEIGHYELGHYHLGNKCDEDVTDKLFDHDEIHNYYQKMGQAMGEDLYHHQPSKNDINGKDANLTHGEPMNIFKVHEFEADEYAIRCVGENEQSYYAGVILFFNHLTTLELALQKNMHTHPIALNRLNNIESKFSDSLSDELLWVISQAKKDLSDKLSRHSKINLADSDRFRPGKSADLDFLFDQLEEDVAWFLDLAEQYASSQGYAPL